MSPFKRLLILLLITSLKVSAQTTPNIGFENGTFDNWQCYSGYIDAVGNISVSLASPVVGRQAIIGAGGGVDPYGKFPTLCPNGSNYSVKLGDILNMADPSTTKKASRITYTFTAPATGAYSIIFNYAVVLENPNHVDYQQPKFTAFVYDVTDGKYIDCPSFDFVAGTSLPGFKLSDVAGAKGNSIYYKEWSTATIDLKGYLGKQIRLEFTANDCTLGGHFGYAYIDVEDSESEAPITGNAYCNGQKSITLVGPTGFSDYYWYNGDMSKLLHTGQSYTISPPPPDLTQYALQIFPYAGLGCVDTLYTVVNKINSGFTLKVKDTIQACTGVPFDLTAASVTAGSSADMKYSYYSDSLATTYLYNPKTIGSDGSTAGTYYIKGINAEGCQGILPVYVYFATPEAKVIEPAAVDFPTRIDLSKAVVPQAGLTYGYFIDAGGTIPLTNYTSIKYSGTYYVKATNSTGCSGITPVNIIIHPPSPYIITSPNTFTPNNDGINDYFNFTIEGIVTFIDVKIYNRQGQLIFTIKSLAEHWDGNYNGKNVPAGTYYWVFEGQDDYNNVKVNRAGSITLIR